MIDGVSKSRTLFDTIPEPVIPIVKTSIKSEPEIVKDSPFIPSKDTNLLPPIQEKERLENELYDPFFSSEKPIERLIVFYKDQTFKVYNPSR